MEDLVISGVQAAPVMFDTFGVTHAVSFKDDSFSFPNLHGMTEQTWLRFNMYDRYFEPGTPDHDHAATVVDKLIAFGRALPADAVVGLNCQMGISRSTAAGFILCAAVQPDLETAKVQFWRCEREIGQHCAPNQTLLEIADDRLNLGGGMIEFGEDLFQMYAQRGGFIAHRKGMKPPPGDPFDEKDKP